MRQRVGQFAGCLKRSHRRLGITLALLLLVIIEWLGLGGIPSAAAGLTDDRYDGNIFALYAGNGSLVPPRVTLAEALRGGKPSLLVIYVDDSRDCKQFSSVISQLQDPYGRVANFIPIMADAIPVKDSYAPNEPGYYFDGSVPKTVILTGQGEVVYEHTGIDTYEAIDDVFRQVFDLLPRSESVELKRRPINEINTELVPEAN